MTQRSWYIHVDGATSGPFADDRMLALARSGELLPEHLVTHDGMTVWCPAGDMTGFEFGTGVHPALTRHWQAGPASDQEDPGPAFTPVQVPPLRLPPG